MFAILSEGFLLGLSTGFHCVMACLPALVPYLLSEGRIAWRANCRIFLEFLAGRFLAYSISAVVASALGKISQPYLPTWAAPLAMALTALFMLASLFFSRQSRPGEKCLVGSNPVFKRVPLAIGFMTGINICPPFVAAFVRLVGLADIGAGLFYFTGFFTATSLFMLPVMAPALFMNERVKDIGRMTLFIAGIWYLILGIKGLL
ncbi:MAG: sulfite exporter TauE/SafE family protein [Elusimicrobia bacterium]|nr:sulfite exporter TauE/SafE family protein [Elusimicrobiota bacterium]